MPIKSWDTNIRLPRLGEIRLGEKTESGKLKALDYFVVPPEVQEVYGPKPTELDVLLPSENLEAVFPAYLKRYGQKWGLICKGDEETACLSAAYARLNPADYGLRLDKNKNILDAAGNPIPIERVGTTDWVRIPCSPHCPWRQCLDDEHTPSCRPVATLNVLLHKVPGMVGVYTLSTTSYNSYQNLRAAMLQLRNVLGRISYVPLKLRVRMLETHPQVNGRRITSLKPILDLRLDISLEQALELLREKRLIRTSYMQFETSDDMPETLYSLPEQTQPTLPPPAASIDTTNETVFEEMEDNTTSATSTVTEDTAEAGVENTEPSTESSQPSTNNPEPNTANEAPAKPETEQEPKTADTPPVTPTPSSSTETSASAIEPGKLIEFTPISMPRPQYTKAGLYSIVRAKVKGQVALWEVSWLTENLQIQPQKPFVAVVEKVKPNTRQVFVKELKPAA